MEKLIQTVLALVAGLATTGIAHAEDAQAIQITQWNWASGYNLFNPAPDDKLRAFATDRPTKSYAATTVDAGRFQIETDLFSYSYSNYEGVKSKSYQTLDPVLKLGITDNMDFEIQFNGLQGLRTNDAASGAFIAHGSGFGDVLLKARFNLIGNDGGPLALALLPYVTLPSQTRLVSDGVVEGGLLIPMKYSLSDDYSFNFLSEFDVLKNANDIRRHANFVNIICFNASVPGIKDLTASVEFYSAVGTDVNIPAVYTFDTALAYNITPTLQVDAGVNFGLNDAAPKVQVYTGVSKRF